MTCPSTFFGVQCQREPDHPPNHGAVEPNGYVSTWDDLAADQPKEVQR